MELKLKTLDILFDELTHTYTLNGKIVPSVTTITRLLPKEWLPYWLTKEITSAVRSLWTPFKAFTEEEINHILEFSKFSYKRSSGKATATGNLVHNWCEQYIKTKVQPALPSDQEAVNCIKLFLEWEKENNVIWIASEIVVASETYMFAGKIDALAIINGELCLIDFKTSKSIYSEYYLQTAAYQLALEEMGCPPIAKRYILRLPKKGGEIDIRLVPSPYDHDRKCFISVLNLERWLKKYDRKS